MRLFKYMGLSCEDEDVNIFRSVNVKLVEGSTEYKASVEKVQEKYTLNTDVIEIVEYLNKQLNKVYKGKLKFDFCLDDNEGITIDKIKLNERKRAVLKRKFFEACDKIGKAKTSVEKQIYEKQ